MKTKLITTLTALLMLVGIGAQAQTDNQTPASTESTDLEGDLNHDGKVDVADVTYLVNLIMKNQSEAKDGTYYWYIGVDNPASISDIQTDNTKPGWHEIGESLDGFVLDATKTDNQVILNTENVKYYYYVVIPDDLHIYESSNTSNVENIYFDPVECNIAGYKAFQYKVDPGTRTVKGIIIRESNEPINDNFYWYIGVDNPASISDIQSDNTKPGWHEIGSSLDGFVLDTNTNKITVSTTNRVIYYVVIPNDLHIYNGLNINVESIDFVEETCNITGYKAFRFVPEEGVSGVRTVQGPIIKEGTLDEPINDNFYWYIGVDNPASISDIQTDNTKPGWHEIGASLDGFVHDMNNRENWITLVENATSADDMVYFYIVVPDGVSIVNGIGTDLTTNGQVLPDECSISGYKAYKYYKKSITVKGTILKGYIPVSEVSISTSESSINVGNTIQLEATISPSNATNQNVTWSSSNPEIATVDETTGLVTGVAVGTATITATSVDGGKTATTRVEVVETLSNYYWYIGVENPSSISDIQTDNTKPGWHEIGASLAGFELDTNDNRIALSTERVIYYVIIPNDLHIYNGFNQIVDSIDYISQECNINGYKSLKIIPDPDFPDGVRYVQGPIIKE